MVRTLSPPPRPKPPPSRLSPKRLSLYPPPGGPSPKRLGGLSPRSPRCGLRRAVTHGQQKQGLHAQPHCWSCSQAEHLAMHKAQQSKCQPRGSEHWGRRPHVDLLSSQPAANVSHTSNPHLMLATICSWLKAMHSHITTSM
jgi:hypothetical protein